MSYIDDFILTDPFFHYNLVDERIELGEVGKWKTKDYEIMNISDMEESHIKNVIRMLNRSDFKDEYLPLIQIFERELEKRHERRNIYRG